MGSKNKTDNKNIEKKLVLRRYFLDRYPDYRKVLDCCAGHQVIWNKLKKEYPLKSYLATDKKRINATTLCVDSTRIIGMDGMDFDVYDIDTYGSPWKHWERLIKTLKHDAVVFLTISKNMKYGGGIDNVSLEMIGVKFSVDIPVSFRNLLTKFSLKYCLTKSYDYGIFINEAILSETDTVYYIGLKLKKG